MAKKTPIRKKKEIGKSFMLRVKRLAQSSNHQKSGKIPGVHCVITNCAIMWQ
jgi:hypothetical protein